MSEGSDDLDSIRVSIALTARHLAEAAGPLAENAVRLLGAPPASAPPPVLKTARLLAEHADPVAAAAASVARVGPRLGIPPPAAA